ncbi:bifunctional methylenetetrahydrofolate dehydrogenase/methenyltetrahydrofolate cyclohydrolase FolD [bacterium]|nr:bifunctional methylenetetrahydrofolate dehydrogenase/methenyltetrahydrofolate cyclohydrolase FolD [bacterium]MBU1063516.1 bifunctional methylenetetrahydrofolate dehydrogenase/methenyltetrahydrofolate cyclohydrolase FolD [bacterium]MBU1873683.1 bifunctional methylenetetrahydrofolate dehydrogenase/methenyltetrahydrofolate cyclohydrolase FolD [bacterium]
MPNKQPLIIDGKVISEKVRESLKPAIERLKEKGIVPGLAVVLVGDDPASQTYVRMKAKAFEAMNLLSETFCLPGSTSQSELEALIAELNGDSRFHGILVQLPLPSHLNELDVIMKINPDKDADGIHPVSLGKMVLGADAPLSCTPHGVLMLLKYSNIETSGKHAVVVGRSNIVGKPIANLLLQKRPLGNATVTLCHSKTKELQSICQQADILIAAIGRPNFIDRNFVKDGAVVIDVGINRVEDSTAKRGYRLVGDVNFNDVIDKVSAITPVPGGVGPMTISMLIANTVYLAEKHTANN